MSVVFADVWGRGHSVAVVLPTSNMTDCISYNTFPASLDASIPLTTSSQSAPREKNSLELAQDMVGLQMEILLHKSEHFKSTLSNKHDAIQRCHTSLSDELQLTFALGGPMSTMSLSDSPVLRKKRNLYRKRILERMTPILGDAVQSNSTTACPTSISFVESAAGWIVSGTQTFLWICIETRNETEGTLENLQLCTVGLSSRGHTISTLDPRGSCNIFCVIETPDNRAKSMAEILPSRLRLHYDQPLVHDPSARYPCTISIPGVTHVQAVKSAWRAALGE